jgi:hypothetical protein
MDLTHEQILRLSSAGAIVYFHLSGAYDRVVISGTGVAFEPKQSPAYPSDRPSWRSVTA